MTYEYDLALSKTWSYVGKPLCRLPVLVGYTYLACNRRIGHSGECKPARAGQKLNIRKELSLDTP